MTAPRDPALLALDELLHERGWNAADLARAAGLDAGTVGDYLGGKRRARVSTRGAIEHVLKLRPGALDRMSAGQSKLADERRPEDDGPTAQLPSLSIAAQVLQMREHLTVDDLEELVQVATAQLAWRAKAGEEERRSALVLDFAARVGKPALDAARAQQDEASEAPQVSPEDDP